MKLFAFYFVLLFANYFHDCQAGVTWESETQGDFRIKISLLTPTLTINDKLQITLDLQFPDTYKPALNSLKTNLLEYGGIGLSPFAFASEKIKPPQEVKPGILAQQIIFELEPLLPGTHYLTFQEITFHPIQEDEKDVQLISEIFAITVNLPSLEFNHLDLFSTLMPLSQKIPLEIDAQNQKNLLNNKIIETQEMQHNQRLLREKSFPWIGVAFLFLMGVIYFIAKTKPLAPPIIHEHAFTFKAKAQAKALSAIDQLSQEMLVDRKSFDSYFVKLSNVVRKFIEEQYKLKASTYTTQEFLEQTSKHPLLEQKTRTKLTQFLNNSDRVKFALYEPSDEERLQAERDAKEFIIG